MRAEAGCRTVIHADYGDAHVTAMSWDTREGRADAIKFLTNAEIAAAEAC
jgi:hypothetical protein